MKNMKQTGIARTGTRQMFEKKSTTYALVQKGDIKKESLIMKTISMPK